MTRCFGRFACIDWSGARGDLLSGIAVACCATGHGMPKLVAPPRGRWSRTEVLAWLLEQAAMDADLLVGVDFSAALPFSVPGGYFPGDPRSPGNARALWREVEERCASDPHLAATSYVAAPDRAPYFRIGAATGAAFASADRNGRLRLVERHATSGAASSCFNLVGPAQVGLSSLTGMRLLHRLDGTIPIWPFDPPPAGGPVLVEVYTSIAARAAGRPPGRAKMRSIAALNAALAHPVIASDRHRGEGPIDDHSSDAILTAAWLRRAANVAALWHPTGSATVAATEGWTFGVP